MSDLSAPGSPARAWLSQASLSTLAELALAMRAELIARGMPGARALDEVAHGLRLQATAHRAAGLGAAEGERASSFGADGSPRSE